MVGPRILVRKTGRQASLLVLVSSVVAVAGSCATMTHARSDDRLFVDTEPPSAAIFVQDRYVGRTPLMVDMPRDRSIRVRCNLPEYRDSYATVNREIAPAAGFDGPISAIVDEITGAAWRLQRKSLFMELTPLPTIAPPTSARPAP